MTCYCDCRVQLGICVGGYGVMHVCEDGREVVLSFEECGRWPIVTHMLFVTKGDILPYCISCFLAAVRFPYEISRILALVPNMAVSK